jgi:uncharacterized iron-regulated membrane protein
MTVVLTLLGVTLFPVAALGMLMWLTHLEETLPGAVRSAQHAPAPPAILEIPVQAPGNAAREEVASALPQQRTPAPAQVRAAG